MNQTIAVFTDRADRFTAILDRAQDRWDAPTPCEGWTARDVVAHVIDTQRDFLGQRRLDAGARPDLTDPDAAWRSHRRIMNDLLADETIADREYDGHFGRTTIGATLADFYGWDLVIHGSDIARATGQTWSVEEDEAAALHATADGWGEALHMEGVCAPAVEAGEDASPTDRLLARLGRDPRWRPAR